MIKMDFGGTVQDMCRRRDTSTHSAVSLARQGIQCIRTTIGGRLMDDNLISPHPNPTVGMGQNFDEWGRRRLLCFHNISISLFFHFVNHFIGLDYFNCFGGNHARRGTRIFQVCLDNGIEDSFCGFL
jgi:hypothetical protein